MREHSLPTGPGLQISEALARRDPDNARWQCDLSLSHERTGDVLLAQGDLEGALAAYRAGLQICELLVRGDPADTEWQEDLSVIQERIGDLLWTA